MSLTRAAALAATLLLMTGKVSLAGAEWRWGGDARLGYLADWSEQRNGERDSNDNFRMRLRLRAATPADQAWQINTGLAGSFASDQDSLDFYLRRYRPGRTGVNAGDATVDTFNLRYRHLESGTTLRIGRFATSFTLPIVPGKSLIRNDASNFNIGWTDGVYLQTPLNEGWRLHLVGQLNSRRGTGNTARAPLDFAKTRARTSLFAAIEASQPWGPVTTRMLSLVWIPEALATVGLDQPDRNDYLGVSAKLAASWSVGDARLVAAGEWAHAFNTPSREAQRLPGSGSVGGNAWQASLNLYDWQPGHSLGAVLGHAQAGWLVSNDYRENDDLVELRYRWQARPDTVVELRYRWRREIERLIAADQRRKNQDAYLRVTYRF
ncbi:MAG: hypothetical protein JJU31_05085 [Wenzhouxiangella sp.]|nr:hypothetical protein [Wenzhouxiangella sp.]MCH8476911.1 hypothetical protein [Wenzhouxiangella sp.]